MDGEVVLIVVVIEVIGKFVMVVDLFVGFGIFMLVILVKVYVVEGGCDVLIVFKLVVYWL